MRQVILISGHTCNGKSTLAKQLESRFEFKLFKTSNHIEKLAIEKNLSTTRQGLKDLGDDLDVKTDHQWLLEEVQKLDTNTPIVVDSITGSF